MSSNSESNAEVKVTLDDVTKLYKESTTFPEICALYPPQYRKSLCEDDIRESIMISIITAYHDNGCINKPLRSYNPLPDLYKFKEIKKDINICIEYFKNHTKEALKYIIDCINELYYEDEYDEGEDDDY